MTQEESMDGTLEQFLERLDFPPEVLQQLQAIKDLHGRLDSPRSALMFAVKETYAEMQFQRMRALLEAQIVEEGRGQIGDDWLSLSDEDKLTRINEDRRKLSDEYEKLSQSWDFRD